ncbi:MAG: SpoIID/LytB domain-containing protein [Planctomycetota bacterium]|jgi:stage II sporulation protein D
MDASTTYSRRRMLAAATATIVPLSGAAWALLSSSSNGQPVSSSTGSSEPALTPTDTWNPIIRVNLTPEPLEELRISVDGPFRISAPGSPRVLAQEQRITESPVTTDGRRIRFRDASFPISQIEIVPVRSPSIWVGNSQYRGTVRIFRQPNNRLLAVNALPLEEYLASVINSEMPASFPRAARQAQAIAARSYALSVMKNHPRFDLFATSRSQRYLGNQYRDDSGRRLAGETAGSREIVRETSGIVCTWRGRLFTSWFSAVCGGRTTTGSSVFTDAVGALKSVECEWCRDADLYRWNTSFDVNGVSRLLNEHFSVDGRTFGTLRSVSEIPGPVGDLPFYTVSDGAQTLRIAGSTFRRMLPYSVLYSPRFSATIAGSEVRFAGRGSGHGVGLCQWGANGLGKAGRSALEILRYYYDSIETVRLRPS